jgi:hypothetical protein
MHNHEQRRNAHLKIKALSMFSGSFLIRRPQVQLLPGAPHTDRRNLNRFKGFRRFSFLPAVKPETLRNHPFSPIVMFPSCHDGCYSHATIVNTWAAMPLKSIFSPLHGSRYLFQEKRDSKAISGVFRVCGYPFSNKLDLRAVSGCFRHTETGRADCSHVNYKLNKEITGRICKNCAKTEVYPPVGASKEPYANEINAIYGALSWDLGRRMFADRGLTYMPRLCCGLSWTCEG